MVQVSERWWQGPCECEICGHKWRAVAPIDEEYKQPIYPFECPSCKGMTGHPAEGVEGDGE